MGKQSFLKPVLDRIPKPLRNRYVFVLVLFFAWMLFFDRHDLLTQWELQSQVNKLEQDLRNKEVAADHAEEERLQLEVDREKVAREDYYMKKSGEDVFIVVEEKDQ